jgi:hypothetical protein
MIVKALAAFPGTSSRGWTTRRHKKCTRSILHALALAFPAQPGILLTLDVSTSLGIDHFTSLGIDHFTYIVEFPEDTSKNQIDLFIRLTKQIKHFYAVVLHSAPESAKIAL